MRLKVSFPAAATFCLAAIIAGCSAPGAAEDTGNSDDELTRVCGAHTNGPTQGYDVSYYQGNFNWTSHKVAFGAARISDGTGYVDPTFNANWANMKSNGVLRAAYQFFEPGENEVSQANLVISKVGKLKEGDLPVMLDIEVTGGQSPSTIQRKAQHWLDLVEAGTGRRPFVYSYGSFLETNLGSGFGKYPLWIANYGPVCPSVPRGWTNWVVWQYSDGGGSLDHDVYNGSLADMKAKYASDPIKVTGYLDSANTTVVGWAADLNAPTKSLKVDVYFGGAAGAGGYGEQVLANISRPDVAKSTGAGPLHGYSLKTPLYYCDGKAHPVYAYAHQVSDNKAVILKDAPRNETCAPGASPAGLLRHVTSQTVLAAWKLDVHTMERWMTPADEAKHTVGGDWPATRVLGRTADGAVWLVDGTERRHVQSEKSLTAWNLQTVTIAAWTAAEEATYTEGQPLPLAPILLQTIGNPAIYVLDADPPVVEADDDAGVGTALDDDGGDGTDDQGATPIGDDENGDGDAVPAADNGVNADNGGASSGCSAAPSSSRNETGSSFLMIGLVAISIASRRRRRRNRK
ncbi:MAG: GH25 family lysozyme [Polyangiaceae bacterium]